MNCFTNLGVTQLRFPRITCTDNYQLLFAAQCRAIYDYTANMYDELSIKAGDLINVHHKQEDGWWVGECENTTGIFPATYVETI